MPIIPPSVQNADGIKIDLEQLGSNTPSANGIYFALALSGLDLGVNGGKLLIPVIRTPLEYLVPDSILARTGLVYPTDAAAALAKVQGNPEHPDGNWLTVRP